MLLEPPRPKLLCRRPAAPGVSLALPHLAANTVPVAAAAAASLLALSATGDTVLLAALLGVAAGSAAVGGVAALVGVAVLVRWGTTSLQAVAGAQAVLGPAAVVGSGLEASSAVLAALAIVVATPRGWAALPFGATAALVAAGPLAESMGDALVRLAATAVGVALAGAAGRWLPPMGARVGAGAAAAAAVLAAAAG